MEPSPEQSRLEPAQPVPLEITGRGSKRFDWRWYAGGFASASAGMGLGWLLSSPIGEGADLGLRALVTGFGGGMGWLAPLLIYNKRNTNTWFGKY